MNDKIKEIKMLEVKENSRKLFRLLLLIFPIFFGTMGTISLIVLVTWGIPPEDLMSQLPVILALALVFYVPCIASLIIRAVFFKKD
ncbi:hypothetical protein QU593_05440 [Rossellomorea marisflavi]|nr:hypothetical protein [Rossellomorea marisflavi]WJV19921.1 hypothetical protein QU593_05440 [Rossellomorea marisflavi]